MSDTATEGAAAPSETDVQAQGVQGELESLINEAPERKDSISKDLKEVVSFVQDQQAEKFSEKFREDMDVAVKALQEVVPEDAGKFFTPEIIEGHLHKLASDDEAVKKAFLERGRNPDAWAKTQKQIVENFSKQFTDVPDKNINEDREAVIAAAKPSKASDDEELTLKQVRSMPADKWQALQQKHGVKPYGM